MMQRGKDGQHWHISLSYLNFIMEMPVLHPISQNVNISKNLLFLNDNFYFPPSFLAFLLLSSSSLHPSSFSPLFTEPLPVTHIHKNYSVKGHGWNLYVHLPKLNTTLNFSPKLSVEEFFSPFPL